MKKTKEILFDLHEIKHYYSDTVAVEVSPWQAVRNLIAEIKAGTEPKNLIADADDFCKLTKEEQHEQNKFDLKAIADFFGGWDALVKVIEDQEINDAERSWENFVNSYY